MHSLQSVACLSVLISAVAIPPARAQFADDHMTKGQTMTAHSFTFVGIDGSDLPLANFAGHPILLVNTASFCGYTRQYKSLQALWSRYRAQGLVVVGVPSNDFGGQEPGTADEIKEFCEVNYSVDFPMTDKVVVVGDGAHGFYRWAVETLGPDAAPRWNFHKFLINADGSLAGWFATNQEPLSGPVIEAIEALLPPPS
jgi:glutathione peroxidase